jgi:hypothetical protein
VKAEENALARLKKAKRISSDAKQRGLQTYLLFLHFSSFKGDKRAGVEKSVHSALKS